MTIESRRQFLLHAGNTVTATWLAAHWPAIAAAAEHAHATSATGTAGLQFFDAAEAADVEAIAAQILPGGRTAGAREANVVGFIDRALATFFAVRAPSFRSGLVDLRKTFAAAHAGASFATAPDATQVAFLTTIEQTPFFETLRQLTIIGTLSSPQYGGNRNGAGWRMLGFEDQHIFMPPFGDYDRDYPGFTAGAPEQRA